MRDNRTTVIGSITALATACGQCFPYDSAPRKWATVVACVSGVTFAYFAGGATAVERLKIKYAAVLAACWVLAIVPGCTFAHLSLGLNNTPFGSLSTSIGGGTIGQTHQTESSNTVSAGWLWKPRCQTNHQSNNTNTTAAVKL